MLSTCGSNLRLDFCLKGGLAHAAERWWPRKLSPVHRHRSWRGWLSPSVTSCGLSHVCVTPGPPADPGPGFGKTGCWRLSHPWDQGDTRKHHLLVSLCLRHGGPFSLPWTSLPVHTTSSGTSFVPGIANICSRLRMSITSNLSRFPDCRDHLPSFQYWAEGRSEVSEVENVVGDYGMGEPAGWNLAVIDGANILWSPISLSTFGLLFFFPFEKNHTCSHLSSSYFPRRKAVTKQIN